MKHTPYSIFYEYGLIPEIGCKYKHHSIKKLFTVCSIKDNTVELIKDKCSTIYTVGIDYFDYNFTKHKGRK